MLFYGAGSMTLDNIKAKVSKLLTAYQQAKPTDVHAIIARNYYLQVLSDLNQQLGFPGYNEKHVARILHDFVNNHTKYSMVSDSDESKPNFLFYSANPYSETSELFYAIANWLAPKLNTSPVEVLLPGVPTTSVRKDFDRCGLVKLNMPDQDLMLEPEERNNSDYIRKILSGYLKTNLSILWHRTELYIVQKDNTGDYADFLKIASISTRSIREGYQQKFECLKNYIVNSVKAVPNKVYKPWSKLRLIQVTGNINKQSLALASDYPTLIQQNTGKQTPAGKPECNYYINGYQQSAWNLQQINSQQHRGHFVLAERIFQRLTEEFNTTAFEYLELEKESIGNFQNAISHYHQDNNYNPFAETEQLEWINFLINGLTFKDLDQQDVAQVFKTHIIADDGKGLIPVKLLAEQPLKVVRPRLKSPYVINPEESEEMTPITEGELYRLEEHSVLTQTQKYYYQLQTGALSGDYFKQQITKLRNAFDASSARKLGEDAERVAGEAVYEELHAFSEYYERLTEQEKKTIPKVVKQEVDEFLEIFGDKREFLKVSTCLNIRRNALDRALDAGYSNNTVNYTAQYELTQQELYFYGDNLYTRNYRHEICDITATSKDKLNITVSLISRIDCEAILREKISRASENNIFENINILIAKLNQSEQVLFLERISTVLNQHIRSVSDFNNAKQFIVDADKRQSLFSITLAKNLLEHVKSAADYRSVNQYIEDTEAFLSSLKSKYPDTYIDILYSNIIEQQVTKVLFQITSEIKSAWRKFKRLDIEKKVEEESNDKLAGQRYGHLETVRRVEGLMADVDIDFGKLYASFGEELENQVCILSPAKMLQTLFKYHPWLELSPNEMLIADYLYQHLYQYLNNAIKPKIQESKWEGITVPSKFGHNIQWGDFDTDAVAINYPHLSRLYYIKNKTYYPQFNSVLVKDFKLTRVELYRVLQQNTDFDQADKIVPMCLAGLSRLSVIKLYSYKTIFINISSEHNPTWVVLTITNKCQRTLYFPKDLVDENDLNSIKNKFSLAISYVELNKPYNDLYSLRSTVAIKQQWHAMMFSLCQIFPDKIFTSLLFQKVLVNSLANQEGNRSELYSRSHDYLYPYSHTQFISSDSKFNSIIQLDRIIHNLSNDTYSLELSEPDSGSAECYELIFKTKASEQYIVDAFKIIYTHLNVNKLIFQDGVTFQVNESSDILRLFEHDFSIQYIESKKTLATYDYALKAAKNCAARNRFLKNHDSDDVSTTPRQFLWHFSGPRILFYYRQDNTIDHDIVQMGIPGLETFFNYIYSAYIEKWDEKHQEPSLNLNYKIDLTGAPFKEYLEALANKLGNARLLENKCKPFFTSFEITLPVIQNHSIKAEVGDALLGLISAYDNFHKANITSTNTIVLHKAEGLNQQFFSIFKRIASTENVCVNIDIPAWDNKDNCQLKREYREIQNKINFNSRQRRSKLIRLAATKIFQNNLLPEIAISARNIQESTGWEEEKIYFVSTDVVGYQQQQQQQQAVQQQHHNYKALDIDEDDEIMVSALLADYEGDVAILRDRSSFEYRLDNFSQHFSQWVGSDFDADEIIEKIHPDALEKILQHKSELKFGFQKDSLPAGFYLEKIKLSNSLVLRYSARKQLDDIANTSGAKKHRCFKPVLKLLRKAGRVHGYDRQIVEELGHARGSDYASQEIKQQYQPFGANISRSGLGQIFDYHGANGIELYETISRNIYSSFGSNARDIWQKNYLQSFDNSAEFINKSDLSALALSIVTLKNTYDEKDIWWHLIKVQAKSVGYVRYADLWYDFQKVLAYTEQYKLVLNINSIVAYTNAVDDRVNIQVLLGRLYTVLRFCEGQINSHFIAQHILDNFDKINWEENGFYYAVKYNGYRYWDDCLLLEKFYSTVDHNIGYEVPWDASQEVKDLTTHALRFASQRIKLSISEFKKFKALILSQKFNDPLSLRLYCACLAIGCDEVTDDLGQDLSLNIKQLSAEQIELLGWLNKHLDLRSSVVLSKSTIKLYFEHIPVFLSNIANQPVIIAYIKNLDAFAAKRFINACGLVLQSNTIVFSSWLNHLSLNIAHHKNVDEALNYPFLLTGKSYNAELSLNINVGLSQQLQRIDYARSTWFPTQSDINFVSKKSDVECVGVVSSWIKQGCAITHKSAKYRALNNTEITKIISKLERNISVTYRKQNILLCNELITQFMAIEDPSEDKQQLEIFTRLIIELDNKAHYNELGQIFGVLLTHAKQSSKKVYYSIAQLTQWLTILCHKEQFKTHHFPISILEIVLSPSFSKSLLNSDLNCLSNSIGQKIQAKLIEITSSKFPVEAKQILIQLLLSNQLDSCELIQNYFTALFSKSIPEPGVLRLIYQLTGNISSYASVPFQKDILKFVSQCNQEKLLAVFVNRLLDLKQIRVLVSQYDFLVHCFGSVIHSDMHHVIDSKLLSEVIASLTSWPDNEIKILRSYMETSPAIPLACLAKLLSGNISYLVGDDRQYVTLSKEALQWHLEGSLEKNMQLQHSESLPSLKLNNANELIHFYESQVQSRDANNKTKRCYGFNSISEENDFYRVLTNIQFKSESKLENTLQLYLLDIFNYANAYSQHENLASIRFDTLKTKLYQAVSFFKASSVKLDSYLAAARVLSCLREILLRKTGVWTNSSQMLVLIYAAMCRDENLLYQVPTGEGKSLICMMRAAFMALNGFNIDIFSAKESLSERDYLNAKVFFTAIGLYSVYLTKDSSLSEYQLDLVKGRGGIHFATPGSFSLFYSRHHWLGAWKAEFNTASRMAYFDEVDDLLLDDNTQFNYSHAKSDSGSYNCEAWVYQAVYEFYSQHQHSFIKDSKNNSVSISRKTHLRALCDYIQKHAVNAPQQSTFIKDYIIPALQGDPTAIMQRDEQLRYLLTACHKANGLKNLANFCVQKEIRKMKQGDSIVELETRVAKVVVNKEIKEGATYSELVHQFLHTRLNNEAAQKGEPPNFFIEPLTEIVLALNSSFLAQELYSKKEGYTATPGNGSEINEFKTYFGFDQVVKFQGHKQSHKTVLPTLFCDSEEDKVNHIVELILTHAEQSPILISCEDDAEVKQLYKQINQKLLEKNHHHINLYADTNDTGKKENDVLYMFENSHHVVISARMGRGTNPLPKTEEGLLLIRAYLGSPRIRKQELGRPARYGQKGKCIEVVNYAAVQSSIADFKDSEKYSQQYSQVYSQQDTRLRSKIEKYKQSNNSKLNRYPDEHHITKTIETNSVVQLLSDIKKNKQKFTKKKNALVARLSGLVIKKLVNHNNPETLKRAWVKALRSIEACWLAVQPIESQKDYLNRFMIAIKKNNNNFFDKTLNFNISEQSEEGEVFEAKKQALENRDDASADHIKLPARSILDSHWRKEFDRFWREDIAIKRTASNEEFEDFHQLLIKLNQKGGRNLAEREAMYEALTYILSAPYIDTVTLSSITSVISTLQEYYQHLNYAYLLVLCECFFKQEWLAYGLSLSKQHFHELLLFNIDLAINFDLNENNFEFFIEFITKLNELLNSNFRRLSFLLKNDKKEDYLSLSIKFFKENLGVARLLFDLQSGGFDVLTSCFKVLFNAENQNKTKILIGWIKDNENSLRSIPEAISFVCAVLVDREMSADIPYNYIDKLPAALIVQDADHSINLALWHFILQRFPVESAKLESFKKYFSDFINQFNKVYFESSSPETVASLALQRDLMSVLDKADLDEAKKQEIIVQIDLQSKISSAYQEKMLANIKQQLLLAPPYFSIDYALKYPSNNPMLLFSPQVIRAVECFNDFLLKREIISNKKDYSTPKNIELFNKFNKQFLLFTPEENIVFFDLINEEQFNSIPTNIVNNILVAYKQSASEKNLKLRRLCNLAVKVGLLADGEVKHYINTVMNIANAKRLDLFIDVFQRFGQDIDFDTTVMIDKLFEYSQTVPDVESLATVFTVLRLYQELQTKKNWLDYFNDFNTNAYYRQLLLFHFFVKDLGKVISPSSSSISNFKDNFSSHCQYFYSNMVSHSEDGFVQAMQEINLLRDPIGKIKVSPSINLDLSLFAELCQYPAKSNLSEVVGSRVNSHRHKRQEQATALISILNIRPVTTRASIQSGFNIQFLLTKIGNVISEILHENVLVESDGKNGTKPSQLYLVLHRLFFAICKNFIKDPAIHFSNKHVIFSSLNDLLLAHKKFIGEHLQEKETPRYKHVAETIALLEKLTYTISFENLGGQFYSPVIARNAGVDYKLEERFMNTGLSEQQKLTIIQLGERIELLSPQMNTYFKQVFLGGDVSVLASEYSGIFVFISQFVTRASLYDLPVSAAISAWEYYQSRENVLDINQLLTTLQLAFQLASNLDNDLLWHYKFSDFKQAKSSRFAILLGVLEGWINFGDKFFQKTQQQYYAMTQRVLGENKDGFEHKVALVKLTREYTQLSKSLEKNGSISSELIVLHDKLPVASSSNNNAFSSRLNAEKEAYGNPKGFSVIQRREQTLIQQSSRFFENLSTQNSIEEILQTILKTQDGIFQTNSLPSQNNLFFYEVTQRLFEAVMHQSLENIPNQLISKPKLGYYLTQWIKIHFNALSTYLPDDMHKQESVKVCIKNFLGKLRGSLEQRVGLLDFGYIELKTIKEYLDSSKNRLPKNLQFLINSVQAVLAAEFDRLEVLQMGFEQRDIDEYLYLPAVQRFGALG